MTSCAQQALHSLSPASIFKIPRLPAVRALRPQPSCNQMAPFCTCADLQPGWPQRHQSLSYRCSIGAPFGHGESWHEFVSCLVQHRDRRNATQPLSHRHVDVAGAASAEVRTSSWTASRDRTSAPEQTACRAVCSRQGNPGGSRRPAARTTILQPSRPHWPGSSRRAGAMLARDGSGSPLTPLYDSPEPMRVRAE